MMTPPTIPVAMPAPDEGVKKIISLYDELKKRREHIEEIINNSSVNQLSITVLSNELGRNITEKLTPNEIDGVMKMLDARLSDILSRSYEIELKLSAINVIMGGDNG